MNRPERQAGGEQTPSVLLASRSGEEHSRFQCIFDRNGWSLYHSYNKLEAVVLLGEHLIPVIVSEGELASGGWEQVLAAATALPCPPKLVVTASESDARAWDETLHPEVFSLLVRPYDEEDVLRCVGQAWLGWRSALNIDPSAASEIH